MCFYGGYDMNIWVEYVVWMFVMLLSLGLLDGCEKSSHIDIELLFVSYVICVKCQTPTHASMCVQQKSDLWIIFQIHEETRRGFETNIVIIVKSEASRSASGGVWGALQAVVIWGQE